MIESMICFCLIYLVIFLSIRLIKIEAYLENVMGLLTDVVIFMNEDEEDLK